MSVNKDSFLTICIQTFNRAEFLEQLLDSIADDESYQVLVGDFSTDEIQYKKNEELCLDRRNTIYYKSVDGGIDYGFNDLVNKSTSKYCWMLPDDDIVNQYSVEEILKILKSSDCDFLLLNSSIFSETMSTLLKPSVFQNPTAIENINSKNLGRYQHAFSYIGACVFRRNEWLLLHNDNNIGTFFNHVYVISEMLTKGLDFLAFPTPATQIRANNALWTQKSFQIWTENWPDAVGALRGTPVTKKERYSVSTILYYYAYGALRPEANKTLFRKNKLLMLVALPGRSFASLIIYFIISIKRRSLISEPGYYILKANNNIISRFLLRRYYDE